VSAKKLVLLITIVISLLAFIFFLPVGFDSWVVYAAAKCQ